MAVGLGSFMSGLGGGITQGLRLGQAIQAGNNKRDTAAAMEGAKTSYNADVADNVLTQAGQQAAQGVQELDVNAANANAKAKVGSFTDYVYEKALPQIMDNYIQQGDLQGAEQLRKWSQDAKERKNTELFGKALGVWHAGEATGDYKPFADSAMTLINRVGGDGLKATGYDFVKDDKGNPTGLTFNLKDGDREFQHTFNSMSDAASFLAAQADPRKRVEQYYAQQAAATKLKATAAEKRMEAGLKVDVAAGTARVQEPYKAAADQRALARGITLEDRRADNAIGLEGVRGDNALRVSATRNKGAANKTAQEDEYVTSKLLELGGGNEAVAQYFTKKYLGDFRKGKSPQEFAQTIVAEIAKDPMSANLKPAEIEAKAKALMDIAASLGNGGKPGANATGAGMIGAGQPGQQQPRAMPPVFR